jgi:spoIIIJ-associated protein
MEDKMKTRIYKLNDVEEAIKQASIDLGIDEEELIEKITKNEEGETEIEITVCIDPIEKGRKYIQTILDNNNVEGIIEKSEDDKYVEYKIEAKEFNGVLIGKNSKHLIALQTLVSLIVNKYYEENEQKVVKIDVGGYRHRKEAHLERMAVDFGKQVAKTKQIIKLDNLNSYERKIIHDKLSTWKDVQTHSEGQEDERVLYIEPKRK